MLDRMGKDVIGTLLRMVLVQVLFQRICVFLKLEKVRTKKELGGIFILLDGVLNTDELYEFDLKELAPRD